MNFILADVCTRDSGLPNQPYLIPRVNQITVDGQKGLSITTNHEVKGTESYPKNTIQGCLEFHGASAIISAKLLDPINVKCEVFNERDSKLIEVLDDTFKTINITNGENNDLFFIFTVSNIDLPINTTLCEIKAEQVTPSAIGTFSNGILINLLPLNDYVSVAIDQNTSTMTYSFYNYQISDLYGKMLGWVNEVAKINCTAKITVSPSSGIFPNATTTYQVIQNNYINFVIEPNAPGVFTGTITCTLEGNPMPLDIYTLKH